MKICNLGPKKLTRPLARYDLPPPMGKICRAHLFSMSYKYFAALDGGVKLKHLVTNVTHQNSIKYLKIFEAMQNCRNHNHMFFRYDLFQLDIPVAISYNNWKINSSYLALFT